jgi:hypothetical protein
MGEVTVLKTNPSKIAYWITKYRDIKVNELNEYRPIRPMLIKPENPYHKVIHNINLLAPRMLKHKIKMFVIKVTFPGKKTINVGKKLFYKCKKELKYSIRSLDIHKNPCCI